MTKDTGISDEQAQRILQRAAEIDRGAADIMSVETLRAAAQEAGIADSSFEAALREHAHEDAPAATTNVRRRAMIRGLAGFGVLVLVYGLIAVVLRLAPEKRAPAPSPPPDTPITSPGR